MTQIRRQLKTLRLFHHIYAETHRARICKSLRSPRIDSPELIPPAYVAWRAGTTNRVVVLARQAGNRFLGSFKGLQIRAQVPDEGREPSEEETNV
jgi:hypothetical protein